MKNLSKYLQFLLEADKPSAEGGGEGKEQKPAPKKDDKKKDEEEKPVYVPYVTGYFPLEKKLTAEDIEHKDENLIYSLLITLCRDSGIGVPKKNGIGPFSFDMYDLKVHDSEFDSDELLVKDALHNKYTYLDLVKKCKEYWKEHEEDFKYWKDFLK